MRLVIASNNKNKIREIKAILKDEFDDIVSINDAGLSDEIEETGKTFEENALIKAQYAANRLGCAVLADDSGLEVFELDGRPGIYSARYCGYHGDDKQNNNKLLQEMKDIKNRAAKFTCAIALVRPKKKDMMALGHCKGEMLHEPRGTGGFGYDPLFYIAELGKTMAELDDKTKNIISHRYNALMEIKRQLDEENE